MFIATANNLRSIPAPLKDRMEIIPIAGYTIEDKIPIGTKHLFPKQLKLHGLDNTCLQITDDGFKFLGNLTDKYYIYFSYATTTTIQGGP